jgi:hypothetical protein
MSSEKASRLWIIGAAFVSGVSAVVGWLATIYIFVTTPGMAEVTFTNSHGIQIIEGKATFLFAMPVFQTIIFFMALYANIGWKHLVRKAAEQMAPYDVWQNYRGFSFPRLCRATSIGFWIMSVACLYFALQRASFLIS